MTNLILSETDSIKLREFLKAKLSVGNHEIVFEKKDKTIRVLRGTRDAGLIPCDLYEKFMSPPANTDGKPRVQSTTSLPTYDLEAKVWRSFSFAALISVDGINIDTLLRQADIQLN